MTVFLFILLILGACIIIWRASDGFEVASEYLGRNLTEGVRGATINAIGSSMPELFTTLFFLFILKDRDGFSGGIGTTAGSAIFNSMIIPAAVILVVIFSRVAKRVKVSRKVILRDGMALILCELVLIFLVGGQKLEWWHGVILMSLYAIYVLYMLRSMKRNPISVDELEPEAEEENTVTGFLPALLTLNLEAAIIGKRKMKAGNAWALLILSMAVIGAACYLLVIACEGLGEALHIELYIISVLLASAATSVPDTILSIRDARKGNYDDAVSNALGSNIFDICFALGLPLFLFGLIYGPIEMSQATVANISELRILLLLATLGAFLVFFFGRYMGLLKAFLLLGIYVFFALYTIGNAMEGSLALKIAEGLKDINHFIDGLRFW